MVQLHSLPHVFYTFCQASTCSSSPTLHSGGCNTPITAVVVTDPSIPASTTFCSTVIYPSCSTSTTIGGLDSAAAVTNQITPTLSSTLTLPSHFHDTVITAIASSAEMLTVAAAAQAEVCIVELTLHSIHELHSTYNVSLNILHYSHHRPQPLYLPHRHSCQPKRHL